MGWNANPNCSWKPYPSDIKPGRTDHAYRAKQSITDKQTGWTIDLYVYLHRPEGDPIGKWIIEQWYPDGSVQKNYISDLYEESGAKFQLFEAESNLHANKHPALIEIAMWMMREYCNHEDGRLELSRIHASDAAEKTAALYHSRQVRRLRKCA